jgi:2-C-methyl-D-erythritol 2,4-cyclodiphosphate synthase
MVFRIGFGHDVHRFAAGRDCIIGGVRIEHHQGPLGHSDADVLLHAICDALLGAANLRDIGYHFSDKDPRWKDIDSRKLLAESYRLVQEKGYELGNLDCTVVAEAPRLNPHIPEMQRVIAGILDVDPDLVSIKATTNEKMDAVGREEGITASAVAMIRRFGR